MSWFAGFVDAGFLIREGARALGVPSRSVKPNAQGCIQWFGTHTNSLPYSLLRVYWYDGAFEPTHREYSNQRKYFDAIAATPGIRLRLGYIQESTPPWHHGMRKALETIGVDPATLPFQFTKERRQKGVDTLLALDIVRLAQQRSFEAAVVITGDRDIAEAVRVAQEEGRHVVVALPRGSGCATELRQLADAILELDDTALRQMLTITP